MVTTLKKIINDYCKLTNNNDIKANLLIKTLINIQNKSQYILFNYYVIARTIYDTLSEYKNFNSEILLKIKNGNPPIHPTVKTRRLPCNNIRDYLSNKNIQ